MQGPPLPALYSMTANLNFQLVILPSFVEMGQSVRRPEGDFIINTKSWKLDYTNMVLTVIVYQQTIVRRSPNIKFPSAWARLRLTRTLARMQVVYVRKAESANSRNNGTFLCEVPIFVWGALSSQHLVMVYFVLYKKLSVFQECMQKVCESPTYYKQHEDCSHTTYMQVTILSVVNQHKFSKRLLAVQIEQQMYRKSLGLLISGESFHLQGESSKARVE